VTLLKVGQSKRWQAIEAMTIVNFEEMAEEELRGQENCGTVIWDILFRFSSVFQNTNIQPIFKFALY
jgi:hypothetical protein